MERGLGLSLFQENFGVLSLEIWCNLVNFCATFYTFTCGAINNELGEAKPGCRELSPFELVPF